MCDHRELSASPLNVISKFYFVDGTQRKLIIGLYFVVVIFYLLHLFEGNVKIYRRLFSLLYSNTVGGGVDLQLQGNHKKKS